MLLRISHPKGTHLLCQQGERLAYWRTSLVLRRAAVLAGASSALSDDAGFFMLAKRSICDKEIKCA
jgi:hypothetical protein